MHWWGKNGKNFCVPNPKIKITRLIGPESEILYLAQWTELWLIKLEDSQRRRRSDRKVLEWTKWEEVALCEEAIGEWRIWVGARDTYMALGPLAQIIDTSWLCWQCKTNVFECGRYSCETKLVTFVYHWGPEKQDITWLTSAWSLIYNFLFQPNGWRIKGIIGTKCPERKYAWQNHTLWFWGWTWLMKVGVISEEARCSQRNFSFALTRNI